MTKMTKDLNVEEMEITVNEQEQIEATEIEAEAPEMSDDEIVERYLKRHRRRKIIVAAVLALLVLLAAAVCFLIYKGALAPWNAAAKYGLVSYIDEDDVTAYIETYRTQMGFDPDETDDASWATMLSQYNLTPSILRTATISQLIYDDLVRQQCQKLGLTVSDAEIDEVVDAAKEAYAFADDETWIETLALYGQTEEGYRETVELELLRQKLYASEVEMPTATDEETVSYISTVAGSLDDSTIKHTYYFTLSYTEDTEYSIYGQVEEIRDSFADGTRSMENFVTTLVSYSDNDDLIDAGGSNGWNIDTSEYSTTYQQVIDEMGEDDVSAVFEDDGNYCFVWVDTVFTFPADEDELAELGEEDLPESLWAYFQDYAAYQLWSGNCETYLAELYEAAGVIIFEMPSGLSYDVDMSLAIDYSDTDEDEDESADTTEDSTEAEDASDEETE